MISLPKFKSLLITIISFSIFLFLYNMELSDYGIAIYIMSVFSWVVWVCGIILWKQETGKYFDLFTIFYSFAVLFNSGQCLMWAFGIHNDHEIGKYPVSHISIAYEYVYKSQLLVLMCLIAFHCGALLFYKRKSNTENREARRDSLRDDINITVMKQVCRITLIISTICTYLYWISNIAITRTFGYGAYLYDSAASSSTNNIIILLSYMFIPSIIGMLLSHNYDTSIMRFCYLIFGIYALLCTVAGYRSWIYELVIIVWLHVTYYKKINTKRFLFYAVIGLAVVYLGTAISRIRGTGISINAVIEALTTGDNPLTSAFFELGGSMGPTAVILRDPNYHYPYGNSYLYSLVEMISTRFITFFNPDYIGLGGWYSSVYLCLNYGAGFSFVAEALTNYGIIGAPIWMVFLGAVITKLISFDENQATVLQSFFKVSTCAALLPIVRNTMTSGMKRWFYSTLLIYALILLIGNIYHKKHLGG